MLHITDWLGVGVGVTALGLVLLSLLTMFNRSGEKQLPPGPRGLPLLGSLPFWDGPQTNMEWAREYGDIYSVQMGPHLNIYLNDIDLVNEHLIRRGHLFEDRIGGPAAIAQGLLFGSGHNWKLNRQLAGRVVWRNGVEEAIQSMFQRELDILLPEVAKNSGSTMAIQDVFRDCVVNVICTVIRGHGYDHDDIEFKKLTSTLAQLDDINLLALSTVMSLKMPGLWSMICPNSPNLYKISKDMQAFVRDWVKTNSDKDCADSNLIASFSQSPKYTELNQDDKEMIQSLLDMFFGGLTSVLSAMEFLFYYMLHHPQVHKDVTKEIDSVLDGTRPRWEDRSKLPMVQATIIETMRLASITPSTLPHVATEDTEIRGYHIPKGACVVASMYCLHRDPRQFENPEEFNPSRHIDDNGDIKGAANFMPFGIGPRLCLGDKVAQVGLFLMFTSFMQKFTITTPAPGTLPPFETRMRIVRRLKPYDVVFNQRTP